jgi:hypothetical protein
MNAESQIICERVARATAKTLTLGGAPHPFIEFRDSVPIGGIVLYELRYVTRSLTTILVEIGVAAFSTGNALTRLAVIRSVEKKTATRFAHGNSLHGTYFVRASRHDLLDSLSPTAGRSSG